ncbi:MAG TPA: 50S ribosomal protein L23 [Candidatus Dojkabacteria bacterium]|nr:50S ribosomal protein L23 [Candidatus Dojkabacteria bacterium]
MAEKKIENKIEISLDRVVSEKSFSSADSQAKYSFYVPMDTEKIQIAKAVEDKYKVKVVKVNTVNRPGKMSRNYKTNSKTRKVDTKKAIVTLKKGDSIKDFVKI